MNPLRTVCLIMGLCALACANSNNAGPRSMPMNARRNSIKNSLKPTDWLSVSELESLPSLNEVTFEQLENMDVYEGAKLMNALYHLSQIKPDSVKPSYAPSPSEIPAFIITPNNQKVEFQLNQLPSIIKEQPQFAKQYLTVFITGLPNKVKSARQANRGLAQAFMQYYNGNGPKVARDAYQASGEQNYASSSSSSSSSSSQKPKGSLLVIKVGETINSFPDYVNFNANKVGAAIAEILIESLDGANRVSQDNVHLIGAGMGANVAGGVGRKYRAITQHSLRHITGLGPVRLFAQNPNTINGLVRSDAEFVDVVHTESMSNSGPKADADFYVNGPGEIVQGADNILDASTRAIRIYTESAYPGNQRNFPSKQASSLKAFKNGNGNGERAYMGIGVQKNAKGDFILQVNNKSPFGRSAPQPNLENKREAYVHKPWKMSAQDYE